MASVLDLVYHHRMLAARCEPGGAGLALEEIDLLCAIEAGFATKTRHEVPATAQIRVADRVDAVQIAELGPAGLVCQRAPYLEEGELVEIAIDDPEGARSFRFKARVAWLRDADDGDDYSAGLRLVGPPLLLRYGGARPRPLAQAA